MDQSLLSSRAIIGMYYAALEADPGLRWLAGVSNLFNSDQASETYNWLGQTPKMREWLGERKAKGFSGQGITILNRHYESTIEVRKTDVRRDKTGQLRVRMAEFAQSGLLHWHELMVALVLAATSTPCYDGQFFFDTDHEEGESGQQSNDISVDISEVPAAVHGTTTAPSKEEMQQAIVKAIAQILSFKDDRGRAMNPGARGFLVTVPTPLYIPGLAALAPMVNVALQQNTDPNMLGGRFNVDIELVPDLTWTDSFAVFRTDSPVKAMIRQTEQETEFKAKAEGTEFEFDNDAWQFGIDNWRGAGFGLWQRACYVTLT